MRSVALITILLVCSVQGREISDELRSVPVKERRKIEFLFSYLVQCNNLGFVLFGDTKPAAFCPIPIQCDYAVVPESITKHPLRYQKYLRKAWMSWVRHRHRFRHPNLIICEEYDRFEKSRFLQLIFIDKKKLTRLLALHKEDFKEILGEKFSAEELIFRIESTKKLRPHLNHDEKLLGLILGFGKESSAKFKRIQNGEEEIFLKTVGRRPKGCRITPVSFRGDPDSPEVGALVEIYTRELFEIEHIYDEAIFLTTTLEKLCAS